MAEDLANLARLERDDILHRKSVDLLSADELSAFRHAVQGMKALSEQVRSDRRGFFAHAGRHGVPDWLCPHHTPERLFLPWHRAYLYRFEQALQDQVPGVTLPWWDWTSTRGVPEAFAVEETPDGDPNPLRRSRTLATEADRREGRPVVAETERAPGEPGSLPTSLEQVREEANFMFFSDALEQVHDRVHVWVGGDMGDVAYAAFDPVFWAHHCMIDRVWWLWQQQNRLIATPAAHQLEIVLEPFNMTVRDTLNANALGYDYAGNEVLLEPESDRQGRIVTAAVDISDIARGDFQRADLEIGGIRHTGSSYEGRVFFNNPAADQDTDQSDPSYVDSFHVFAHGGCYGAEGHCDVPDERRRFDRRPLPLAIRMKKRVRVTDALKGAVQAGGDLTVTIVGIPVEGSRRGEEAESVLAVKRISVVTYL